MIPNSTIYHIPLQNVDQSENTQAHLPTAWGACITFLIIPGQKISTLFQCYITLKTSGNR